MSCLDSLWIMVFGRDQHPLLTSEKAPLANSSGKGIHHAAAMVKSAPARSKGGG